MGSTKAMISVNYLFINSFFFSIQMMKIAEMYDLDSVVIAMNSVVNAMNTSILAVHKQCS